MPSPHPQAFVLLPQPPATPAPVSLPQLWRVLVDAVRALRAPDKAASERAALDGLSAHLLKDIGASESLVADAAVSPRAFTLLPATPVAGISVLYASEQGVERVYIDGKSRELGAASLLAPIQNITGMTATDLNGDGAVDVAVAARGNLHILRATLEAL